MTGVAPRSGVGSACGADAIGVLESPGSAGGFIAASFSSLPAISLRIRLRGWVFEIGSSSAGLEGLFSASLIKDYLGLERPLGVDLIPILAQKFIGKEGRTAGNETFILRYIQTLENERVNRCLLLMQERTKER